MLFQTPNELKNQLPINKTCIDFITQSRNTIKEILARKDSRLLLIVGPCSIHNIDEALEYATLLKKFSDEINDFCFLVMRAYIEKPRTKNDWKGLVHDPYLNDSNNISHGLYLARSLFLTLTEIGLPIATEFLSPLMVPYFEDLVSWGCIGARTSSSQIHRMLASYLPMPIGFKNTIDGSIDCAINGVSVCQKPQTFIHIDEFGKLKQIHSKGNPHAHIILRGFLSKTNYEEKSVQNALNALRCLELPPRLLVDCSHGNCEGKYFKQKEVFYDVLKQIQNGNSHIFGMMLESNLEAGSQEIPLKLSELQKGVSITDGCLDFAEIKELIQAIRPVALRE